MSLVVHFAKETFPYTGPELRPHYLLTRFGLKGNALVAWQGPCEVKTEHLVDWEDRMVSDFIRARSMVHFLGEFFQATLREGVLFQRLFMSMAAEELAKSLKGHQQMSREGDDLYWTDLNGSRLKMSVSIVTASPVSVLFHAGINLDAAGAPVEAVGVDTVSLQQLGQRLDLAWVESLLSRVKSEWESIEWACVKVRPVV